MSMGASALPDDFADARRDAHVREAEETLTDALHVAQIAVAGR
jgi:hypothetical protein